MDNDLIVVEGLEAAKAFFAEPARPRVTFQDNPVQIGFVSEIAVAMPPSTRQPCSRPPP